MPQCNHLLLSLRWYTAHLVRPSLLCTSCDTRFAVSGIAVSLGVASPNDTSDMTAQSCHQQLCSAVRAAYVAENYFKLHCTVSSIDASPLNSSGRRRADSDWSTECK